jgi:CRP-like cAMP-binding protein
MLELEKILLQMGREKKFPRGALLHKKGEPPAFIYVAKNSSYITGIEPETTIGAETKIYGLIELMSDEAMPQDVVVESQDSIMQEISKETFQEALHTDKRLQRIVMQFILNRLTVKECSFE